MKVEELRNVWEPQGVDTLPNTTRIMRATAILAIGEAVRFLVSNDRPPYESIQELLDFMKKEMPK